MNWELSDVQAGFRKGRGARDQIANICCIMEKARVPEIHLSSIQLLIMSDSLWPHGLLQRARPPCPSPTPGVYSNSWSLSQWCRPTILSSVIPFSSGLQSFPASGSCPMSQFFASGDQSIGDSASASVLPLNIQDWFPLGWTGWSTTTYASSKTSILWLQRSAFFIVQLSHPYMTTGKTIALNRWTFVGKVMSLLAAAGWS